MTGATAAHIDALIVGAGFAGLYQLHCLRYKLGLSVRAERDLFGQAT